MSFFFFFLEPYIIISSFITFFISEPQPEASILNVNTYLPTLAETGEAHVEREETAVERDAAGQGEHPDYHVHWKHKKDSQV